MTEQIDEEEEFFGVTIPFSTRVGAEKALKEVNGTLGYGGWVRIGRFGEDD